MPKKAPPESAIAAAVRELRYVHRLDQREMAAKLRVSRETISAWECDYTVPPLDQRQRMLDAFRDSPYELRQHVAQAFGLRIDPPPTSAPAHMPPDAAQIRVMATNVIRAAADDLDVAPSAVRKTLAALFARSDEAQLAVESLRSALNLPTPKKRA
jgi:transcriptional regulator with XRE-family HTH domain